MKFEIPEDEMKTLLEWYGTHKCKFTEGTADAGAIGGRLSYRFTPTSLGQITVAMCLCGEEINITSFEDW